MQQNKNRKKTGGVAALCVLALGLSLVACASETGIRKVSPLTDGTYITAGIGKSPSAPITVSTTFAANAIVDIAIGANGETTPILDSVKALLIPRIIEFQTLGVDAIAGATYSSVGVKSAVAAAIDAAGGKSGEWWAPLPKSTRTVKLSGYDVIVAGLGGSGMAAYVKAAESGARVYGIEAAGKIGGNSAVAGGPMAINSEYIKKLYTGGADYVNRDALLKEWYADMEADVPEGEIPGLASFSAPHGPAKGRAFPVPAITKKTPEYAGGPKWRIIKKLIDESGLTVSWLAQDYGFHFAPPMALGYPQYQIVTNYGNENWSNGAYGSDDNEDLFKTTMFTRAIEKARARDPRNGYKLELRATALLKDSSGRINGVKAVYRDGTIYEIYGKAVVLATGGYINNPEMEKTYFGADLHSEAVDTERGDGITMAMRDANAGTYNIAMPGAVHVAQVKNLMQEKIPAAPDSAADLQWKATLTSLLMKGDNLVVALREGQAGDLRGKRFANEASGMMGGIAFEVWRAGGYFAAIYSNDMLEEIKARGAKFAVTQMWFALPQGRPIAPNTPVSRLDDILAAGEAKGNVIRAASLEELAQKLGSSAGTAISPATLKNTVNEYNAYVDKATAKQPSGDPHDKSATFDFAAGAPVNFYGAKVNPNAGSGYTAILGAGYFYGTCGGLDIDENTQVLDAGKKPIPGLYAVGQESSGVLFNEKKAYVGYGAAAMGWAISSGRIAGEHAAAFARQ